MKLAASIVTTNAIKTDRLDVMELQRRLAGQELVLAERIGCFASADAASSGVLYLNPSQAIAGPPRSAVWFEANLADLE
jgi:hypothetical protein